MAGPLDGVRVLEVANYLAAPACGAVMADLGADVVKVEPPDGDVYRANRTRRAGEAVGFGFVHDNRGKRSITLDLARPRAREVVARLAAQSDVFLTNLVPARLDRFGLTFEAIRDVQPSIVYAILTAYGLDGPDANRTGFDSSAYLARSGVVDLIGEVDTPPVQGRPGQGDHPTALGLLAAILAAMRLVERGEGAQLVDMSLLRSGVWSISADLQQELNREDWQPERQDRSRHWLLTRNAYRTSDDRWLQLTMPIPDRYWARLCEAIGRPDWASDVRYNTTAALRANGVELLPEIDAIFATRTLGQWREALDAANCIWAPIQTPAEVVRDPQLADNGTFAQVGEGDDRYWVVSTPFTIHDADVSPRGPAPGIGEHTHEVLIDAGFTSEEIVDLAATEVFG
jgi:crotonobetainyl-CoA:carnitine CoA-transferase CaiB-like acyl-CoA transferase